MNKKTETSNGRRLSVPAENGIAAIISEPGTTAPDATAKSSRLWLWFVAAFVVQAAAWTVWFTIAAQHRIEEVPLATKAMPPVDSRKAAQEAQR